MSSATFQILSTLSSTAAEIEAQSTISSSLSHAITDIELAHSIKHEGNLDERTKLVASNDAGLVLNEPVPDLIDTTADGKYIVIGFRGPAPVTVGNAAQVSCPGVGIVKVTRGGKSGKLVNVPRACNVSVTDGHDYTGKESAVMLTKLLSFPSNKFYDCTIKN